MSVATNTAHEHEESTLTSSLVGYALIGEDEYLTTGDVETENVESYAISSSLPGQNLQSEEELAGYSSVTTSMRLLMEEKDHGVVTYVNKSLSQESPSLTQDEAHPQQHGVSEKDLQPVYSYVKKKSLMPIQQNTEENGMFSSSFSTPAGQIDILCPKDTKSDFASSDIQEETTGVINKDAISEEVIPRAYSTVAKIETIEEIMSDMCRSLEPEALSSNTAESQTFCVNIDV